MGIFFIEIIITIIIGLLSKFFLKDSKKGKKVFLYTIGGFLSIISGLRNSIVGTDTFQYYNSFEIINKYNYGWLDYNKTRYEVGYFWLNKSVSIFTDDPQIFILITSFIITIGIFYFIYKNSSNVIYSVIIYQTMYYYCSSMNLMRQYIAIAIAINSFTFLKNNKIIKACILILIGGIFHTSALFLLPIVIVFSKFDINKKNIYKIIGFIIVFFMLLPLLINIIIKLFPKYEFYLTYESGFNGGKIMPFIYIGMIFIGYFLLSIINRNIEESKNYYYTSLYVLIGALLLIVANIYFASASRLTDYFLIYFTIFLPELFRIFDKKTRKLFYILFFIFSIIYYRTLLVNGVAGVFPFIFYLQ